MRYVPDLRRNLISLGEFDNKGYEFRGRQGILRILKGSKVVVRGHKRGGLYSLKAE